MKFYHKSPPTLRDKILKEGLTVQVGDSFQFHHEDKTLTPCIFLYDKSKAEYDSTYDDDIWEVKLETLDDCIPDLDYGMYETYGAIMCLVNIPVENISLIYEGTGKDN